MKVKLKGTRNYAVNLFADFLLEQIPKDEKTIIQIADCKNFLVIKGKTTSDQTLDLLKLKNDFLEKYQSYLPEKFATHTIDLIDYSQKIEPDFIYSFDLYQTENPIFDKEQIKLIKFGSSTLQNKEMIITSEFPHGHSLSMGRTLFYYSIHLVRCIPSDYFFEKLKIKIPNSFSEENFDVFVENEIDEKLKSFFLDHFDFNYNIFRKKLNGHELHLDLVNPLTLPECVEKLPKDLTML